MNTSTQYRTHTISRDRCVHPLYSGAGMLVAIDASVDDWEILAKGVLPGARVIILLPEQDGVKQITAALENCSAISSIHIISHGSPGGLYLGNAKLDSFTLERYAADLEQWKNAFTEKAEILIYGCHVAANLSERAIDESSASFSDTVSWRGIPQPHSLAAFATQSAAHFIHRFSTLTETTIAASTNLTGNAAKGGDWNLAYRTGKIFSSLAFSPEVRESYPGVFATLTPAPPLASRADCCH